MSPSHEHLPFILLRACLLSMAHSHGTLPMGPVALVGKAGCGKSTAITLVRSCLSTTVPRPFHCPFSVAFHGRPTAPFSSLPLFPPFSLSQVQRFYDATGGMVTLDGLPIAACDTPATEPPQQSLRNGASNRAPATEKAANRTALPSAFPGAPADCAVLCLAAGECSKALAWLCRQVRPAPPPGADRSGGPGERSVLGFAAGEHHL